MSSESQTQARRILMLLHAAWPNEVPAPELAKISLQYCARLHELKKTGWTISNRVEYRGRAKHGFYRLGNPPTPRSSEIRQRAAVTSEQPSSLLGDLTPFERHRDLG